MEQSVASVGSKIPFDPNIIIFVCIKKELSINNLEFDSS